MWSPHAQFLTVNPNFKITYQSKNVVILHKQTKFQATSSHKSIPWGSIHDQGTQKNDLFLNDYKGQLLILVYLTLL
jgi:hypothetical protein